MLKGIITLLLFQFLGESVTKLFSFIIPGPVIGMLLLLLFLLIRKKSFSSLDNIVMVHLKYLPMLFIPAAMGIITQFDVLSKEFIAISFSLIIGTILALAFSAKLMDYLTIKEEQNNEL
ncbi:CidA/LrgA family protein [Poseidonibacter sp.]|uniref:CidA/LrgA family protein n=1 Tax=Poseidonibacter sp. TaxID=2321188 RepID=UPI003C73F753